MLDSCLRADEKQTTGTERPRSNIVEHHREENHTSEFVANIYADREIVSDIPEPNSVYYARLVNIVKEISLKDAYHSP